MVKQGEIFYVDFSPSKGREQQGNRPAIAISSTKYNFRTGFVLACPITSTQRAMRVRIPLDDRTTIQRDLLCEQVRIIDLKSRPHRTVEHAPRDIVFKIHEIINSILLLDEAQCG